jgi:integrase
METPIHPDLLAVRAKILASQPCHVGTLQKVKERLALLSDVEFVAQQLRKTFASTLYDADVPDEVVKDLIGHTGDVTRRYAPISRRKRVEAIERLHY